MSVPSIPVLLQMMVDVDGERFYGVRETRMHACPRVGEQVVVLPLTHEHALVTDVVRVMHLVGGSPLVLLDVVVGCVELLDVLADDDWDFVHAQTDADDYLSGLFSD